MSRLDMIVVFVAFALPMAPAAARDGATLSIQRLGTGAVLLDRGEGFKPSASDVAVDIGNRVRIRSPAIAVLAYDSGCELTLRRPGTYVVRACDLDEDRDQEPDDDSDDDSDEDSEQQEQESEATSQDPARPTGAKGSLFNLRNLLLAGTGIAVTRQIHDALGDNDRDDDPPLSP